jgi:hypothetical protein
LTDPKVTDDLIGLEEHNLVEKRRLALRALADKHGRKVVRSKWKELRGTLDSHIKAMHAITAPTASLTKTHQASLGLSDWITKCKDVETQLVRTRARLGAVLDHGDY